MRVSHKSYRWYTGMCVKYVIELHGYALNPTNTRIIVQQLGIHSLGKNVNKIMNIP